MSTSIIADKSDSRRDPVDEAAALYLDAHPEVRALLPAWAETVEAEADGPNVMWGCSLSRGEVQAGCVITVNEKGQARSERPTVFLPGDNDGWLLLSHAELVERLRALSADLAKVADIVEAAS